MPTFISTCGSQQSSLNPADYTIWGEMQQQQLHSMKVHGIGNNNNNYAC